MKLIDFGRRRRVPILYFALKDEIYAIEPPRNDQPERYFLYAHKEKEQMFGTPSGRRKIYYKTLN